MSRKSRSRRAPRTPTSWTPAASWSPDFTLSNEIIASLPPKMLYSRENRGPVLRSPTRLLPASNPRSSLALQQSPEILAGAPPSPQVQAARLATKNTNGLPSIEIRKPFVEFKKSAVETVADDRRCNKRPDSRSKGGSGRAFVPWKAKPC